MIPVARVAFGFGWGFAAGEEKHRAGDSGAESATPHGEGEVGGGGVHAYPAGALEITDAGTRFIPFAN